MKRKICFVALGSYPLFTSNEDLHYVGGAELKQVLIGNELSKRGFDVSFITYDEEGERKTSLKDITIIKTYKRLDRCSLFQKVRSLWRSFQAADSGIYIQAGGVLGLVAFFCFITRRRYIKWIASDENLFLKIPEKNTPLLFKILLFLDIMFSSMIIAQNEYQKQVIEKRFNKKNVIIKNPIPIPPVVRIDEQKKKDKYVLWVGTIRSLKQPEIFLKIAHSLPRYQFRMIGGRSGSETALYDLIREEAEKIPNLDFLGFVSYDRMPGYYDETVILVNTSKAEGFPNTFLEAWVHSIPVVSLNIDPDEVICTHRIGLHSKTLEQMVVDVETLLRDDLLRHDMGSNGKKYVEENHNITRITDEFVDFLNTFEK